MYTWVRMSDPEPQQPAPAEKAATQIVYVPVYVPVYPAMAGRPRRAPRRSRAPFQSPRPWGPALPPLMPAQPYRPPRVYDSDEER